jgi:alkanesulfonate monooxygenase SsuD/methylene tetrahydromethanopterin reductase-like flavin-dependent oxidoreductase (luciferase family)/putative sterol carrier protein
VRFSLLYELQLPRPWAAGAEHRLLTEALEQIALADRLGFDAVWAAEHHFLEEYSHAGAPGVFLGAAAARTKDIRLGFAGTLSPPRHPAQVAEAAATLDLISGGRVELGTAAAATGAEVAAFGIDRATLREQWAERLDVVARMLVETPFAGVEGRSIRMPPRDVVPKPLQSPHPPLWATCTRRDTVRDAAERGLGARVSAFVDPEDVGPWVDEYYDTLTSERCVPAGFAINPNVSVPLPLMVHADEAEAIARGIDGAHFHAYARAHFHAFGEHQPGRTSLWDDFVARRDDVGFARAPIVADGAPLAVKLLRGGLGSLRGAIGTPDQINELIARYDAAGVDELVFLVQTGKTEHAHVMEALELFATAVMPAFAADRPAREDAKRARLGDAERRALERRAARRTVPRGYAFKSDDNGADPAATAVPEPSAGAVATTRRAPGATVAALRRTLESRGERAFQAFVGRSGDGRIERTAGSATGLRVIFGAMERQFVAERAGGFTGDLQYDLRGADGAIRSWTVTIAGGRATARPGASAGGAKLTITLATADFVRIAARELDPVKAVLTGRLELAGDFAVAMKLGEMFGQ